MKYFNDLLRISAFVLILYTPLEWLSIQDSLNSLNAMEQTKTFDRITTTKKVISTLLQQGRILESCQRLKAEQEAGTITTYLLKSPDADCHYPDGLAESFQNTKSGDITPLLLQNILLFYTQDTTFETQWAFSVKAPIKLTFTEGLKNPELRASLIKDLLLAIYIIFAFIFCAVLILAKSIQNQYRKKGKDPLWLKIINSTFGKIQLHDLKIIKSATSILIQQNEGLIKDNDLLETSLEYSILNEVKENNHIIPYTFFGTVAKVDINGFSKVISAGNSVQSHNLTLFLEDFGCEILQRYNGLFEKTVGDEIIVIFKTEDSALFATAFARDLMTEFSKLKFDIANEKRNFTLKGAISSSDITFSKRAPGYGFNGNALTYSSRLMDMVTLKDRNMLSCMKEQGLQIQKLVNLPTELKKFEFKNMDTAEGYLIDTFLTIDTAYATDINLIKFFRSDSAFIYLLKTIQTESDLKKIDQVFTLLKQVKIRKCALELIAAWMESLEIIESKVQNNNDFIILLAKLVMIGSNLIPQNQWDSNCTQALLNIQRDLDGRVNASIIDVLIEKTLYSVAKDNESSFIIKSDHSFRTRGNLLINQAYHHLDNSVFNKIVDMVKSPNPLEISTGLFCACSIIIHYQNVNPAELETYSSYRKLIKLLRKARGADKSLSPRLVNLLDITLGHDDKYTKTAGLE
ncbi:MAG: hypothetical protein WA160_02075 [Pseudobdellovibrio sp.]